MFEKMPGHSNDTMSKAVAEYIGSYPIDDINRHENARITKQEYIHTSPAIKNKVHYDIECDKTVKQVFIENFNSDHQPRDPKYIQNQKYLMHKNDNPSNTQNVADDM